MKLDAFPTEISGDIVLVLLTLLTFHLGLWMQLILLTNNYGGMGLHSCKMIQILWPDLQTTFETESANQELFKNFPIIVHSLAS